MDGKRRSNAMQEGIKCIQDKSEREKGTSNDMQKERSERCVKRGKFCSLKGSVHKFIHTSDVCK